MAIFEFEGKRYRVRDEHIERFAKDFPDATSIMERNGKRYRVKSSDYKVFMSEVPENSTQEQPRQQAELSATVAAPKDSTPIRKEQAWQPAGKERVAMQRELDGMARSRERTVKEFGDRMETMREFRENAPLGSGTAMGKRVFNPESGKLEQSYITPAGNRFHSRVVADAESLRFRQAADMSVGGRLRRATQKLAELKAKRAESASRVHEETERFNNEKLTSFGRLLIGGEMYRGMQQGDRENNALDIAIRETEELIKDLEEQKDRDNGTDVGFWRGFWRIAGDARTWDFGTGDLKDALMKMNADRLTGENATDGERDAYNEMMMAIHEKEEVDGMYGGNASFWNRAGVMTGYMPSFMLDFVLTGGGFSGINILSKVGVKAGTKVIGKEVVEQMVKQGFKTYVKSNGVKGLGQYATNWIIKALGTTADDLLIRAPLMTNTVQLGKTASDIIDRKLGDVVVDENGNYDFSNDKTWGSAIWQGEANAIIENYSEMFGAHLDPVMTLGNIGRLAHVVGAKRIGNVLAKADAGALSGIMGQTHKLFSKMGVSDYLGEVAEEYYGQLWRTMLNLDDAYQSNPDGSRTNLLATGQFHGDIWGGMALSMGLMDAGKHTLNAATYASMKHGVNKADVRVNELLGTEIWEPLKATIDLTTNENVGEVAELIVNDDEFTNDEKAAILEYMERSMYLRGLNLASVAQSRNIEQNADVQQVNESFLDGYSIGGSQEMNDAKNLFEFHREQMGELVDEKMMTLIDTDPVAALEFVGRTDGWNDDERASVIDYINAKQVYDGMIQRVRDDIDARVEQSNAMIDSRVNRSNGMILSATMKDDRKVYVISGKLVPYSDGNGIDKSASDGSIIVRDAETGALEQVSPDAVLNIDEPLNPSDEKMTAEGAIRQQFAQEASDKIDGVVTFNPGDTYTITGDDAQIQVQIVANESGIVDNGDGTVNVSDGVNIFPLAKETIQQQVDVANLARVAQFEQQRTFENAERKQEMQEANSPQYALNDIVLLTDENGNSVRGNITADADADGKYEVYTEDAVNGKRVNLFTADELNNMIVEHNGQIIKPIAQNTGKIVQNPTEIAQNPAEIEQPKQPQVSAFERIPKDEQGNPLYEQAETPDLAWDAIVEQTDGDMAMAQSVADGMVADKDSVLKRLEKAKSKGGATIAEKIAAEKERKAAIDASKQELAIWQKIAGTANRRKMEAEAERRRIAEEAAALRKVEVEKVRAEREEAERIEREVLNGVPDMVDDTPQDARARGYRRVSGHKIDRQEAIQALLGKEIAVKFNDSTLPKGRVAVIEAEQLQPSHIQGVRNPLHFIDEAQPKERNDEASVLSARKIAGNIRPEEITSSVTAYTGAPTVNARGEAIQGNNRSDALRLMWEIHQGQAAKYKQYLMEHAEEFGLNADDIAGMQHPVLVNMLDVEDADAISLGQFMAQDTESGGLERIKPKNVLQRMGADTRSFANLLLKSADEETSFAGLVDNNGVDVLKWMSQKGYITPTQYRSAFDSKGNLSAEAKNDLRGIMYQSIFKGGSTRLEEMFNAMPAKAQKAILATAFRDYDSPSAERMIGEIQNSIRAYYALSQSADFVNAKTFKDARLAVEGWKIQYQIDDATGESYLPAENFGNFALLLATMYKGENQSIIQGTFNKLYDLIQGTQEESLFEHPDNTPRTLAQAINETLNITYNGQQRSNVLVGDSLSSQRGQQGSTGNAAAGERIENGERTADSAGGIEAESAASGESVHQPQPERKGLEQTSDVGRKADGAGMADDSTREVLGASNRGNLRVFEEGLDTSYRSYSDDSERTRRTTESERLVNAAKQHGMFIPAEVTKTLADKVAKRTGESVVYIDKEAGKVTKVKDPYAKSAMKNGVQPEDAAFEHLVHNLLFPETEYTFEGISEEMGDVRIVLSQNYIPTYGQPTTEQIAEALAARGLFPEDNYSFGNELVSVTDVEGDNVLLGEDGTVYFIDPIIRFKKPLREIIKALGGAGQKADTIGEQIQAAEAEVNTSPTTKQKEAGNYKKGHVQIGSFNVTIEQPKGSVRSGVDANGNRWETEMQNTYGYIRGTEGVDGDHIDVFLSDNIDEWDGRRVFVVDQYNADGTFDEHKVMLGFNSDEDATDAYFANYEKDWGKRHRTVVSSVNLEDFEKWIDSSHRKKKAFFEYKSVKVNATQSMGGESAPVSKIETTAPAGYTVRPAQYTTKKGKVLDMQLVKFGRDLTKEELRNAKALAKGLKGWYDSKQNGFMMRSEDDAKRLADAVMDESGEMLSDAAPVSIADLREFKASGTADIKPTGHGAFGDIYDQFKGKAQEAIAFLSEKQNGEAIGALHHKDVGDIDLVWGNEGTGHSDGFGLAKLVKFHPEVLNDLQGLIDDMHVVSRNANRITLESDTHKAAVRLEWDGEKKNWLLTAFEKENSVRDNTTDTGTTVIGKQNDTATLQNTVSIGKNSDNPSNKQNPSGNKLVTDERYEELKRRMKAKLGQLNMGIDPEILAIGTEMAVYHIEKGARDFAGFAKAMIADLGDVIRPYLKAFYNGARDLPEVVENGLSAEMTPYDEVSRFDVANFDKENTDPFATAEMVVSEQEKLGEAAVAKQLIIDRRNSERRKENEQTEADTEAIVSEADAVAGKAESDIEDATDEKRLNGIAATLDKQIEKVNSQLALLGYYEAEEVEKDFNEMYGYMRNAEKKAVKDANFLAKKLVEDLGIDAATLVDSKGKKLKEFARANIAPASGEIYIGIPLGNERELEIFLRLEPDRQDNLYLIDGYTRIRNLNPQGREERWSRNVWINRTESYQSVLKKVQREIKRHVPGFASMPQSVKTAAEQMQVLAQRVERGETPFTVTEDVEKELSARKKADNSFKVGEKVMYKGEQATIHSIDNDRPVLDTGLAPVMYEVAEWADLSPVRQNIGNKPKKESNGKKKSVYSQTGVADLFGGLFDGETVTEKENQNGLQRNDAVRTGRLPADGGRYEERLSGGSEKGSESESEAGRGLDAGGKGRGVEGNRSVRPRLSDAVEGVAPFERKNTRNNHSERGADHAPTSVDARIEANIKAIELAQLLIGNGDKATPEQMDVLRKFSGWGGLGKAFSDTTYSARLQELLGKEGYESATMSANSSYYTPAYVVDTLWDIAQQLGFEGGSILEGSAGIGNILGQMPTSISERSDIRAVEIDPTSGSILSLLYPDAQIDIQGFEETRIPNGSIDLAITNVPFVTGLRVNDTTSDKDLSRKFHNIHDFCIAKNVRKLRPSGIGIFITSNGTLDNSKKLRDWVVNEGGSDFVGAFRMNNTTFGGTSVTSDIIVIRKRVNGRKSVQAIDVSSVSGVRTAEFDTGETRKVKGVETPVIKKLSMDYNKYFIDHPENMAGEMSFAFEHGDTYRPTSKGLYPTRGTDQKQMLAAFVQSFIAERETSEESSKEGDGNYIADASTEGRRLGELYEKDGRLVVTGFGGYYPLEVNSNKVKGHTKVECFRAYAAIKEVLADVMEYQTNNDDDAGLQPLLDRLNKVYDSFVKTYGHFNKNTAISFLRNDVDYPNVFSLERYEETGDKKGNRVQKFGKTDVFSRRVVEKEKEPTPTNVKDGIIASVFKFGRIDTAYIAEQLGEGEDTIRRDIIENGYGFEDPVTRQMELSYQYLSGNVREKLRQAQENNDKGQYSKNIKALEDVMPMDIPAHLIEFTLGSSWINPKMYEEYVKDRTGVDVIFTAVGGTWFMKEPYYTAYEKNRAMGVESELLGRTVMGHTLIEAAIQNKSITVSTTKKNWDGSTETITDKEATQACSVKIDEIRQDFKDWSRQKMQSDPELSAIIEREYNDMFNNYVPMSIPDEFVPEYFGGASRKFKMRPHQGRAIVRGTMQPLLLAHEVGTGKTFTLISIAMEMRRLGTARKPMIVVQNATVGQFVASAKELYPKAKILTLEEADRSAEGRKNFYAKIRYNDWDMIVVPQSTFEFIPDSEERQMEYIQSKIEEKMLVLDQMKDADPRNNSAIARQAKQEVEKLRDDLATLTEQVSAKRSAATEKKRAVSRQNAEVQARELLDRRTDEIENFDDMGIDALLIDEAHEYKHLGFATAMQRGVKGVDPSPSKKSQGVYLKTQAVLEKNNGRNVVFATGTPISNTAAEIWTFMRYLMPEDTMKEYGIYYFDDFVRNFGNIQQMLEFTTSGKFKESNRFAGYVNLPELVRIWSGVSDTVLTKEAGGVNDKIPAIEGGKAQDIYLPQTRALRGIMKFVKAQLDEYEKLSGKEKKENSHIPLTMYGIAKAAAVDARLVVDDAEDDPNSKTNEAVRQTLRSLKETAKYKGTVAIFADNYQNKATGFNIYDDIREKLIAGGVPADEVVVIRSGMTIKKKLEIFDKVNSGQIRVVLGSTFTLGTGVNIQERLHTLIHLDAPNRPMDYTQRNGRILRQGNLHKAMGLPVRVLRFGVEDSLDVTAYQRLKTKGAIADSIMNGKQMMLNSMTNRVLEEEEDVFGDTVAQLSGSEYAMLKNNAEKNVRKFESRKKQWEADQTYIHNAKPRIKGFIKDAEQRIEEYGKYLSAVRTAFPDGKFTEIATGKHRFTSVEAMEEFFKEHNKSILAEIKKIKDGDIAGEQTRELPIKVGDFTFKVKTVLHKEMNRDGGTLFTEVHRKMTYSCPELGKEDVPVHQSLLRNAIEDIVNDVITGKDFAERLEAAERSKKHNEAEMEQLLSREGKLFEYEEELAQAKEQYEEYSELMKKELEEKEAKYAEMDATVEAADHIAHAEEDDVLYRSDDTMYRIREEVAPQNTGIGYKVFVLKNGELYPPMVANPGGEATPVGVWLDADAAPIAGQSKTGRSQVKAGGKGTQGGSGKLAYRPGWHLGVIPYALQFNRNDENGERTLFPSNFVWAEVEYANDVDYQEEAMSYGYNKNGKFQHSYAGLPRVPENGAYTYRTNPNPETDPWVITGAIRVKRLLTPTEVDEMVKAAGREPQRRQDGAVTDAEIEALNAEFADDYREGVGTYTDDEVSWEQDLYGKGLGKPYRRKAERRTFAARERKRMAARVEALAKKLHLDNVEVVTDSNALEGKNRRAKGFYSKSTGKITIVIPNHRSTFDVEQTLLHEAVAHYGLRQLFGEHFDTFLDNVFNNAGESIRRKIVDLSAKNGWEFRKATEEYLAGLAERTNFEEAKKSGWWQRVKDFFSDMLGKLGFANFGGVTLTDNELRYVLWRSYENLKGGKDNSLFGDAADIAMQYELGVGKYEDNPRAVNERFNEELERYAKGEMGKNEYIQVGNPMGIMRNFMPDIPIILRQKVVTKANNKHKLTASEIKDLPKSLANPIFVFKSRENTISVLTELKSNKGQNIFVAMELGTNKQMGHEFLEVNDITTIHGRETENIVNPILENVTLRYVHKEKGIKWLSSAKSNSQAIATETLSTVTKIVENFKNPMIRDENDVLFRDGDPEMHERTLARQRYEQRMKSGMYQSQEALQDSMLGLKEAMTAILGKNTRIEDVAGFENAYLGENRLSSVNKAEADAFAHLLFKPMLDEVAQIAHGEAGREELTDYMMAKHGLERNRVMAERDAQKEFADNQKQHPKSSKSLQDFIDEFRNRDYAGLTDLTGMESVADAEAEAQAMVEEYENGHDTTALWSKVNAVSAAILSKSYECGMMGKESYENVKAMYRYYIPLRGFDEKTSAEAYSYLTHRQSAFNAPIKKAEGRVSKADDPFANLQSMAESAIMQGNRNRLVKQRFLNFVLNHPSDLVSVSDLWLRYDAVSDEWIPVFPDNIEINDSPEVVERKVQDFEERMRKLAESDPMMYKHGKDAVNIPYRVVESRDLREHQVVVKRNGRDYVITVNGNPRVAQALNGQTNPDNDISGSIGVILRAGEWINRQLSAFYTTRNPDFIVSNFVRDMLYTNSMVWIKENPNYALRFNRNVAKVNPARMKILLAKHRNGRLDMDNPVEKMFHLFMMNGGETGYANIRDIDQHKDDIKRELKKANGKLKVARAWELLGERFDELNRAVENCARFAAFMTSHEMGRTIDRAIYDAKEISVNFNKKGSGAKFLHANGQSGIGNVSAFMSGIGRSGYVFWNAAIQGTTNFGRQLKRHPAKALTGAAAMFLLGAVVAYLGGDDDDDEKNGYYNLPEYVRRSNLLFSTGDHWVSLPLPIEYRAFYGMGELMTSVLSGKEHFTGAELAEQIAAQVSQILPLDLMNDGGLMGLVPSAAKPIAEVLANKSWTGMPIYKDTPYNKYMPEWTKTYKSANKYIVGLAVVLNEATGGDPYSPGVIDINPAQVEYLLNGYFGGVSGTIDKLVKSAETVAGEREYDPRSFLLWNRLVKAGDERTEYRAVNNEYFRLKEEHDRVKFRLKRYEDDTYNGVFDYAEKIDFLYNSPEYERYEIFEWYMPEMDALYNELKIAVDDDERREIETELNEVKKEMIAEMNLTRKRK